MTIPLGIGTPPWPTYVPLQVQYFKRLAPNGANGQVVTHSNHVGTHLDGEIHFYTPGKDIASLELDFLMHEGAVVDLSDVCGDYDIYTSKMVEERVEVKEGDILIIHTGYHHYGWDQPTADEIRYMVKHPGPDREFADWAKKKKLRWIGVDCGSADHPMNTKIREWMPRQAKESDAHFEEKYGKPLDEVFTPENTSSCTSRCSITASSMRSASAATSTCCSNQRATIGCFPWRFVDGESCISRIVAFVDDDRHAALMAKKAKAALTKFGDIAGAANPKLHAEARKK